MQKIIAELQQAGGADAAALLPAMIRGDETMARIHGVVVAGDAELVTSLAALDGKPLKRIMPMETIPDAGRLEVCLNDRPAPPLAKMLALEGRGIHAMGTSVVDRRGRFVGVVLLLWRHAGALDSTKLRRLRRRCAALVAPIGESWSAAVLDDTPATAMILHDRRGDTHCSAQANAWLAHPTARMAAEACIAGLAAGLDEQVQRAIPGALVSAVRLDGDVDQCMVTFLGARNINYPNLLRLNRLQRRIAVLAALGLRASEIGREIGRAKETVRSHLRTIYRALSVSGRRELGSQLASGF